MQIWEAGINSKGGLLGRPVKLVCYDDQSNPATIPGIYTKLLDVDRVDLIVSGYATNMIAPAMPIIIRRRPPITPRSCARSRPPMRISCWFAPSGHSRHHPCRERGRAEGCSAAAWSVCRAPP
jgi:Periplasmic binding protein